MQVYYQLQELILLIHQSVFFQFLHEDASGLIGTMLPSFRHDGRDHDTISDFFHSALIRTDSREQIRDWQDWEFEWVGRSSRGASRARHTFARGGSGRRQFGFLPVFALERREAHVGRDEREFPIGPIGLLRERIEKRGFLIEDSLDDDALIARRVGVRIVFGQDAIAAESRLYCAIVSPTPRECRA